MSPLTKVARRVAGRDVREPELPVEARGSHRSMVFSVHDERPGPSRRLLDLAIAAGRSIADGEVNMDELGRRPNVPGEFTLWPGEHYKLLAAIVHSLRPKQIVQIGTWTGLSALAMKKFLPGEGKIATFDLRAWRSIGGTALTDADFADGRLTQYLEDLSDRAVFEKWRGVLESAELIFIDGPKDNVFEYRLMAKLKTLRFPSSPILMFNGTRLWSMLKFWRELPYPKLDWTSFGSWRGTGLAEIPV